MSPFKRRLISAFIIFNVLAIAFGSTAPMSEQNAVSRFFTPYVVWTRLLQNWRLFVPTPRQYFLKYHAEIILKNGQREIWEQPYAPNWDFFPRHLAYQFQKWDLASDYLERPKVGELLWTDLAGYLVRIYSNPENPPEKILFIRSRAEVPPPIPSGDAEPNLAFLQWTHQTVHTYLVKDRSLQ